MLRNQINKAELSVIPVPIITETYSPVPHMTIIDTVLELLDKRNLVVTNESYRADANGNKMTGMIRVNQGNSDMEFMIAFKNSYDKSMSVGFAAGSQVIVCENGCVSGEISMLRRHTGNVVTELTDKINFTINSMEDAFNSIYEDSELFKQLELNDDLICEFAGRMFIKENMITSAQLSIIKREFEKSTYPEFSEKTAWSFYNWCTHALKESHSSTMIQDHINLHKFFNNYVI